MTPPYEVPTYVQGTLVGDTVTFTNTAGVPTDPTTVICRYVRGDGLVVAVAQGSLTHVGTGVWQVTIDTTPAAGEYQVYWAGTGALQAAQLDTFLVTPAP